MTNEEAKNKLLQATLYRTVAAAGILWIPATKLANCSPNWNLKMTLAAMIDFNAVVLLILAGVLFLRAAGLTSQALKQLNSKCDD